MTGLNSQWAAAHCTIPGKPQRFTAQFSSILAAFTACLLPSCSAGSGYSDSYVVAYIKRSLEEGSQSELAWLSQGLSRLDQAAVRLYQTGFTQLRGKQQHALMMSMENGELGAFADSAQVFNRLHRLAMAGMFSEPKHLACA